MMPTKLLIYDGTCSYCRGFVRLVRFLDRRKQISTAPFDALDSQELLRAQFGDNYGLAMYLFGAEQVSWGAEAARRIIETLSCPHWTVRLAFYVYPSLVELVSKLTQRTRPVCGPECAGLANQPQNQESVKTQETVRQRLQDILRNHTLEPS